MRASTLSSLMASLHLLNSPSKVGLVVSVSILHSFTALYTCVTAPPKLLDCKLEDTIYMKVGSTTILEVPYSCFPKPTVSWTFKDGPMPDKKRFKEETILGMTCMTLGKVVRTDSGTYKVVIKNELGSLEKSVKVIVQGQLIRFFRSLTIMSRSKYKVNDHNVKVIVHLSCQGHSTFIIMSRS